MKILTLCTYPIKSPQHGGQFRVQNIVNAYRKWGYSVQVVGVLGSDAYELEDGFLAFPGNQELSRFIPNPFLMEDYALGRLFGSEDLFYSRLKRLISSPPDVIHVEQPWLFDFAARYRRENVPNAKIIYGSQNIECHLKRVILQFYFEEKVAQQGASLIEKVEIGAIEGADGIMCVSEGDAIWTKAQSTKPIALVPNGVKSWQASEAGRNEAAIHTKGLRYALYCASAHPPNVIGFFELFGGGFGSLKPDQKLVIAGSAGWSIAGDVRVHQSPKLAERVIPLGVVSQPCLEGLLDGAHCIVLPLTLGGGTNLKTAEAIFSGKYVIATSCATRGFERFIGSNGFYLADSASEFKRALRIAMNSPVLKLSAAEIESRRSVLWDNCFKEIPDFLELLVKGDKK